MISESIQNNAPTSSSHCRSRSDDIMNQAAIAKERQLLDACKNGHRNIVEMLLDRVESPPNIEVKGHGGVTPLHWASNNGDRDAVKLLLDKGANINAKTDCGVTPLHLACYHGGNKSVITLLLNRGACLDSRDHDGYTPLHYAGIKSDIVDLLIKRGAKKDVIIDEIRSARSDDEDHAVVAIGTLNVAKIYRSDSTSSERNVPRKVSFDSSLVEYDVFLSHCWGEDAEGRDNHERAAIIHHALKMRGLNPWFDSENMEGNIIDEMARGIDKSNVVIVFVTRNYISKVAGDGENGNDDNCKMEFEYAKRRKGTARIITVVMEESCNDQSSWNGPVGMCLGGDLYYKFNDDEQLETCVNGLVQKIESYEHNSV